VSTPLASVREATGCCPGRQRALDTGMAIDTSLARCADTSCPASGGWSAVPEAAQGQSADRSGSLQLPLLFLKAGPAGGRLRRPSSRRQRRDGHLGNGLIVTQPGCPALRPDRQGLESRRGGLDWLSRWPSPASQDRKSAPNGVRSGRVRRVLLARGWDDRPTSGQTVFKHLADRLQRAIQARPKGSAAEQGGLSASRTAGVSWRRWGERSCAEATG
jgi:hypothetical protein